jgi:hypothetical protein
MYQDKIVARILLIFSLANVALAAPAVRERHPDVADTASEKRAGSGNKAKEGSASEPIMPELASDSDSFRYLSVQDSRRRTSGQIATFYGKIHRQGCRPGHLTRFPHFKLPCHPAHITKTRTRRSRRSRRRLRRTPRGRTKDWSKNRTDVICYCGCGRCPGSRTMITTRIRRRTTIPLPCRHPGRLCIQGRSVRCQS